MIKVFGDGDLERLADMVESAIKTGRFLNREAKPEEARRVIVESVDVLLTYLENADITE